MRHAAHLLTMLLIVVVALLAGALAQRFSVTDDWTYGNRNTLTPASERVLKALDDGPITLTAYIYPGPKRETVRTRLSRYVQAAPNVKLRFADPSRHPRQVRQLGIGQNGAVEIRYQGRSQLVTDYSEPSVTNALQRLSDGGNPWVVFVTGHGERDPGDKASAGYSDLAQALDAQGLRVRTLNLARAAAIPENTGVLVIASPQHALLSGEVQMIRHYVAQGGNLLWVDDPGPRFGLVPLAQDLGVHWNHGTVVYPDYRKLGTGSPAMALVATYPDTPITENLKQLTLFPFAGGLSPLAGSAWHHAVFLRSSPRSWLEAGSLDKGSITFKPDAGDQAGPLDMGLALNRKRPREAQQPMPRPANAQRAAVIADSAFMDNGHIGELGNRTLALAVFQWLAYRDAQIAVNVPKAPDAHLQMAPARIRTLWWVFVVALPLLLTALGIGRWWLRRRR